MTDTTQIEREILQLKAQMANLEACLATFRVCDGLPVLGDHTWTRYEDSKEQALGALPF